MGILKIEKENREDSYKVYITDSTEKLVATLYLKNEKGEVIQTATASLNIKHKGVAIYIAFPDYKADPELEVKIPYFKKKIKAPKIPSGHAGILLITNSGKTAYYEFGRYAHSWDNTKGYVRRVAVPDVKWDGNGIIDVNELNKVFKVLSKKSGQNGNIKGAYIETNYINRMLSYAERKHIESVPDNINDPTKHKQHSKGYENLDGVEYSEDREEYSFTANNCGTFALEVVKADENISVPSLVINTSPNNIQDELIEEGHKDIFYNSTTNKTTIK